MRIVFSIKKCCNKLILLINCGKKTRSELNEKQKIVVTITVLVYFETSFITYVL